MYRRKEPQLAWNYSIKYRMLDSDAFKDGMLVKMDANSALLWLAGEHPIGSNLEVLVQFNDKLEHDYMRVVRIGETNHQGYTGYGCKVGMTLSEAA